MVKTGVILADGSEEGEALTIVDIFRRAEIPCEMIGLQNKEITGAHGIQVLCDRFLSEDEDLDLIVLPGGYDGATAMAESPVLQNVLKKMNAENRRIAAICAGPLALDAAGVLDGKTFTCYPSTAAKIHHGTFKDEIVVTDGRLVTSQGPGTAWAFAYRLVEELGCDSSAVKKRMTYDRAFREETK